MRSVSHFTPAWEIIDPASNSNLDRGAARHRGRKRSRSDNDETDIEHRSTSPEKTPRIRSQSRDTKDPYYVAGHDSDDPLPSSAFPHAAAPDGRHKRGVSHVQREFASLNPPLYTPPPSEVKPEPSQVKQHVAVLNTILHTSLMRGDYIRAGRAFAMLLRLPPTQADFPIRANGHWGIGAEILLRRPSDSDARRSSARSHSEDGDSEPEYEDGSAADIESTLKSTPVSIPPENFVAEKSYYESLILQYPYHRTRPHATDARSFYPAYFSLCIYEVSHLSSVALQRLETSASTSPSRSIEGDADVDEDSNDSTRRSLDQDKDSIKQAELTSARDIAARMDEVLISPPYDQFVPLLRMRGMIGLWLVDLCQTVAHACLEDIADMDPALADVVRTERGKAKSIFQKVQKLGGTMEQSILDACS